MIVQRRVAMERQDMAVFREALPLVGIGCSESERLGAVASVRRLTEPQGYSADQLQHSCEMLGRALENAERQSKPEWWLGVTGPKDGGFVFDPQRFAADMAATRKQQVGVLVRAFCLAVEARDIAAGRRELAEAVAA